MKFENTRFGTLILGVVFVIFMAVVSLAMMLVILPMVLIPIGIAMMSPTVGTIVGAIVSLGILLFSLFVIGWAVFYFYRKNVFVYKKR